MSVSLLYCEGGDKSPDSRILSKILAGVCTVEALGSKYGFNNKIMIARGFQPATAGIRDREFDNEDEFPPKNRPRIWSVNWQNQTVQLGWLWERKEIENYIIDPDVVQFALGAKAPLASDYRAALDNAANLIADYSAARIALSQSRIHNCVQDYNKMQTVSEADVLTKFQQILPTCRSGSVRFQHYLTFFSGKDLLCGMERVGASFVRGTAWDFCNVLVERIANSKEDIANWLPEWQQLRKLVMTTTL